MFPNATASGAIRQGAAVSLVDIAGNPRLIECSAASNAMQFQGFAVTAVADGAAVGVATLRGSVVVPILEGGGVMTAGQSLFLSGTLGEVTHTVPITGIAFRVGSAFSTTTMTLNTDSSVQYG